MKNSGNGISLYNLPKLGFGFMRFPEKENKEIDFSMLKNMVDEYMKNGFNYFDTSYVYYDGESERAIKSAVVDRYPRESFFVADKLPAWELTKKEDVQRIFDESLDRAGVQYFDFYLLHSIEYTHVKTYDKYDCWNWAQKMKAQGKIHHFGISFHETPELLDKVLSEHPEIEVVYLQINYVDWENKIVHSGACYDIARKHNKPIIIMEPVKGGTLAVMRPEWEARFKAVSPERSVASWAMRFCLSLEGVAVVLSGMSAIEQMIDNIATTKNYTPFSEKEKQCLGEISKEFLSSPNIPCTSCRYCISHCPMKIDIPGMMITHNTVLTYGDHDRPHYFYGKITEDGGTAASCIKCEKCESVCPQHIKIMELMEKVSVIFDNGVHG
jgi:predicted aldo/keto reductase-like oxidoreductase